MEKVWTPAERVKTALTLGKPDEIPTFELDFQLTWEFFGLRLPDDRLFPSQLYNFPRSEIEKAAIDQADKFARIYGDKTAYDIGGAAISGDPEKDARPGLDYAIIPVYSAEYWNPDALSTKVFRKRLREHFGNTRLFGSHGDGTFRIPDGNKMYEFSYRLADDPEGLLEDAQDLAERAVELNRRQKEADLDVVWLCSDYCYNSGPFMSPAMFDVFITPFLTQICKAGREDGLYVIKHTDGNIMPIIESLVAAGPHALHSLDPMAGVDIREVKRLYGDKVALCGNVHCAAMQTGTEEDVINSAEYCLKYGGAGGGYIFTTSNVPFRGMPPERYQLVLDTWKRLRKY